MQPKYYFSFHFSPLKLTSSKFVPAISCARHGPGKKDKPNPICVLSKKAAQSLAAMMRVIIVLYYNSLCLLFLLFLSHLLFSPQSPSLYSPLETKINITGSPFMLVMCVCSPVCVLFCYIIPDANLILFYFDGLFLAVAPCQLHALSACIGMTDIRA